MAAVTVDTAFPVLDFRFPVFDMDDFLGAAFSTFPAADAVLFPYNRFRQQNLLHNRLTGLLQKTGQYIYKVKVFLFWLFKICNWLKSLSYYKGF